jgi:hypothetical protein
MYVFLHFISFQLFGLFPVYWVLVTNCCTCRLWYLPLVIITSSSSCDKQVSFPFEINLLRFMPMVSLIKLLYSQHYGLSSIT